MRNRNYLSNDFLAIFENRVRSTGVWCDTKVNDKLRHYFIAKNPGSMLAISLCGQVIQSIEGLHENVLSQKCLVCDLFGARGREANEKLESKLVSIIDNQEKTQAKDSESADPL